MMDATIHMLIEEDTIRKRVNYMAHEILRVMPDDLLVVALLRGSFMFAADLLRALHAAGGRPQVDFMTAGSYGSSTESSGVVTLYRDLNEQVKDRAVLLLDD